MGNWKHITKSWDDILGFNYISKQYSVSFKTVLQRKKLDSQSIPLLGHFFSQIKKDIVDKLKNDEVVVQSGTKSLNFILNWFILNSTYFIMNSIFISQF